MEELPSSLPACGDLLQQLDVQLLLRLVRNSCREALRAHGVDNVRAKCTAAKLQLVLRSVRADVDAAIGLSSDRRANVQASLHELVLGEEPTQSAALNSPRRSKDDAVLRNGEPWLTGQLRDLLEAPETVGLLRRTLDQFFAVVHGHCVAAARLLLGEAAPDGDATDDSGLMWQELPVVKFLMKMSPELGRICEGKRDNEFLLALKEDGSDADSVWDSFFLDVHQMAEGDAARSSSRG